MKTFIQGIFSGIAFIAIGIAGYCKFMVHTLEEELADLPHHAEGLFAAVRMFSEHSEIEAQIANYDQFIFPCLVVALATMMIVGLLQSIDL